MNSNEVLRIVDAIHRDKGIDKEVVFAGIEAALLTAARKHFGDDAQIEIHIDRETGEIRGTCNGKPLTPEEMAERIGAQTAKQVMIQKIREAERDAIFREYSERIGQLVVGTVQRFESGSAVVTLTNTEAYLPRNEQIPGETLRIGSRVRAVVSEVRRQGAKVRIILSRIRRELLERLFEQEIPEVADRIIEIKAIAREPGYRSKVAVSSTDPRVDPVGACVGVRGSRIKNIVDELGGERIEVVRWDADIMNFVKNALQPAEAEEVILCQMLGRAIVLVREDQLSLAIGRWGQNVRLASKLCGWDIEIMTRDELERQIEEAFAGFASIEGVSEELADRLVGEGFLTYDDLSVIEPDDLMALGNLTAEQADKIIAEAEARAEEAERERERQQQEQAAPAADNDHKQQSQELESETQTVQASATNQQSAAEDLPSQEQDAQTANEQSQSPPAEG